MENEIKINGTILKNYFLIIKDFLNETTIKINDNGLNIVKMDCSNISMIVLNIPKNEFIDFGINTEIKFSINVKSFIDIIKNVKNEFVVLKIIDNNLNIKIDNFNYSIPLIADEETDQKIPDLDFKSKIIGIDNLKEIFKNAKNVNESIEFSNNGFKAVGELSNFNYPIEQKNFIGEETNTKYSLEYLNNYFAHNKLKDNIVLNFGKDYPLMIEQGFLKFILAPRVEN